MRIGEQGARSPGSVRRCLPLVATMLGCWPSSLPAQTVEPAHGSRARTASTLVLVDGAAKLPQPVSLIQAFYPAGARSWLPDTPLPASHPAEIRGTVSDVNGGVIGGASVSLEEQSTHRKLEAVADANGFFTFPGVSAGTYQVSFAAAGFQTITQANFVVHEGQDAYIASPGLPVASTATDVRVVFTEQQLATEQVHLEEKQRVLGIIPNFYTSYVADAAKMSPGLKWQLAARAAVDPLTFVAAASTAGVEQWQNIHSGFGQGAQGYGKRFGATYADRGIGIFFGDALLPVLFRQDPRYFYKGTGTLQSRAWYAMSTAVICRGDNKRWQPNYSNVLGAFAAGAISTTYYPLDGHSRESLIVNQSLIGIGFSALDGLVREFVIPRLVRGGNAPKLPPLRLP